LNEATPKQMGALQTRQCGITVNQDEKVSGAWGEGRA
jgi:hypothetical protein